MNKSVAGGTVFGASAKNMEDLVEELKYNFPVNYAKWVMENRDKAPERYRGINDKNELITKISFDIKGFLIVEQIYYPKMFGTEFFFEMVLDENRKPSVIFGDNTEYSQFRESGEGDNCAVFSADKIDKEEIKEKIQALHAVKTVTGQVQTGLPPVDIDKISNILEIFLTVANRYSILNADAKWHVNEFSAVPCVSANSRIIPLKGKLTFSKV